MSLVLALNQLAVDTKKAHPNIHLGGCAILASILGEYLEPLGPIRFRAFSFTRPEASISEARQRLRAPTLEGWHNAGVDLDHLAVEIALAGERYVYDANGLVRLCSLESSFATMPLEGWLTREELEALLEDEGWNDTFSRGEIDSLRGQLSQLVAILSRFNIAKDNHEKAVGTQGTETAAEISARG